MPLCLILREDLLSCFLHAFSYLSLVFVHALHLGSKKLSGLNVPCAVKNRNSRVLINEAIGAFFYFSMCLVYYESHHLGLHLYFCYAFKSQRAVVPCTLYNMDLQFLPYKL